MIYFFYIDITVHVHPIATDSMETVISDESNESSRLRIYVTETWDAKIGEWPIKQRQQMQYTHFEPQTLSAFPWLTSLGIPSDHSRSLSSEPSH